mmetsp:Transcript_161013/g.283761  ORF Transcript_161013/g.283761 Transcript_161013/m.283761 type:complete len:689 (+) Transcript_161013:103-2169(+)
MQILSASMMVIASAGLVAAMPKTPRTANILAGDGRRSQVSIDLRPEFDFLAVKPSMLADINVDKQSDEDAKSVAFQGATTMMVSADLDSGALHLHPAKALGAHQVPVAWVSYNNTVQKNGWSYLSAAASKDPRVSRDLKMYAAGFLEGLTSAQQIRDFQHNANLLIKKDEAKHNAMGAIHALFDKELKTIVQKANMKGPMSDDTTPSDPFWQQARYALMQSWGMMDAYNRQVDHVKGTPVSLVDLIILNSDGETPELEVAYDMQEYLLRESERDGDADAADTDGDGKVFLQRHTRHAQHLLKYKQPEVMAERRRSMLRAGRIAADREHNLMNLDDNAWRKIKQSSGRCSALVRLTNDNKDLMVGHTTFSDYAEMTRIFKYYDFPLGDNVVQKMGFSSYPGVAGSTDDYYLLDSGLVVTETTISMLTDEPYDKLDDNGTMVPDFMRIMIANRLAKTGKDWVDVMKKSATGTYSSQWMVVDYNLFEPGKNLSNGTLWVIEQTPGINHARDMTSMLQSQGYWSSENRAWFKEVRDSIGATEAEDLHGALFSADHNPRANIFKATAPEVQTLMDMRSEMQRNRWPHEVDGGPTNEPDHAIAARGDLAKDRPDPNGGVDAKVTNFCLARQLQCDAISGPTHESQKPFKWTDSNGKELYPDAPHDGLPDLWNFDWVRMTLAGEASQLLHDKCQP